MVRGRVSPYQIAHQIDTKITGKMDHQRPAIFFRAAARTGALGELKEELDAVHA